MGPAVLLVQFHVGGLQGEAASGGHGIPGVHGQVHEHLLELMDVHLDRAQIGVLKSD